MCAWMFLAVILLTKSTAFCQENYNESISSLEDSKYASNSVSDYEQYSLLSFPSGHASKETSEMEISFPTGVAHKETSSSRSEETDVDLLYSTYEPSESLPLPTILSTETFVSQKTITEYNTVYIYPDSTETATITETDTSYYFTFRPGDVSIFTDALESQSTITLTAYVQDFAYSGIMVTPPVEYTTEYFTATTTVDQITKLQPSTVYTTVPTTLTDTTTITVTTQALNVMETVTSNYYVTTTSTSAETNLQTDVMWVQTLLDETTTYVYTMRSLDRFQPYYLSTQVIHSTATITVLTTTTTTPLPPPVENNPQQPVQEQMPETVTSTPTTTTDDFKDPCAGNRFYRLNQIC